MKTAFSRYYEILLITGACTFVLLGAVHVIYLLCLGLPIPALIMAAVWAIFCLAAEIAWRTRLSAVWVFIAVGCTIFLACSYLPAFNGNLFALVGAILSYIIAISSLVLQIKFKIMPRLTVYPIIALLIVALTLGGVWGGNALKVENKTGAPATEIWGVPAKYDKAQCPQKGTLQKLSYKTKAYATDRRTVTKEAYIYLPYGYSDDIEYNVLYLLHGTGDGAEYWMEKHPENKLTVDNLIYHGDIEPLIIVMPTWYVENDCADNLNALTYSFNEELKSDLLPAVEGKYSTYAQDVTNEAFASSREHRAFAGLSRGAFVTFHSALLESLDYFSWFGAFSGCATKDEEFEKLRTGGNVNYSINYLYNTSGSFDFMLVEHTRSMRRLLKAEPRLKEGENYSFDIFPMTYHEATSWHIALYNFLQKIF